VAYGNNTEEEASEEEPEEDLPEAEVWVGDDLGSGEYGEIEVLKDGTRVAGEWMGVDFEGETEAADTQPGIGAKASEIPQAPMPGHQVFRFPAPVKPPSAESQASKQSPSVSPLFPVQASVPGIGAEDDAEGGEQRVPIHELDIIGWNPSRSGHGRSIRFKLSSPAPDTGYMSRYYTWVPEEKYEEWKRNFTIEGAINASRNKARLLAALRKRTG
jgi:hypothetical protein